MALAHGVPAAIERRTVVLRLSDCQLVGNALAFGEVAHDPCGKLLVQCVDGLVRCLLISPEAGLDELVVHMFQHVGGILVVPFLQLGLDCVQTLNFPHLGISFLRRVFVKVRHVILKVLQTQEGVDAVQLPLGIGHQILILHKQEAFRIEVVTRQERHVGFLEVGQEIVVAQEVLDVIGLCHADE